MTRTSIIPWKRYGLIAELTYRLDAREPCSQFGKTALQKLVYLLQATWGIDCGYAFNLHTYGPFTSQLLQDLDQVENMEGVSVGPLFELGGYQISPGERNEVLRKKAERFLKAPEVSSALDSIVEELGGFRAAELELRSTIVYVAKEMKLSQGALTREELCKMVRDIKPRFSEMVIHNAIDELCKKGHITVAE